MFSVSTLVILAGFEDSDGDKPTFETVLLNQIKTLKTQLGKDSGDGTEFTLARAGVSTYVTTHPPAPSSSPFRFARPGRRMDTQTQLGFDSNAVPMHVPGEMPPNSRGDERRDVRAAALAAARLGRSYFF